MRRPPVHLRYWVAVSDRFRSEHSPRGGATCICAETCGAVLSTRWQPSLEKLRFHTWTIIISYILFLLVTALTVYRLYTKNRTFSFTTVNHLVIANFLLWKLGFRALRILSYLVSKNIGEFLHYKFDRTTLKLYI